MSDLEEALLLRRGVASAEPARALRWLFESAHLRPYLLVAPALFFLLVFTYYPLFNVVTGALYRPGFAGSAPSFVGLANFRAVFADPNFPSGLAGQSVLRVGDDPAESRASVIACALGSSLDTAQSVVADGAVLPGAGAHGGGRDVREFTRDALRLDNRRANNDPSDDQKPNEGSVDFKWVKKRES